MASMQLKTHLESKGFFAIKQTAMELAPQGVPNFPAIFDSNKTGQISTWNRIYGKETTAKLIFVMLEDLNNYFNVQRPMTTAQMTDLAIEMTDVLWGFRLEEILAFSECMKKQVYGKIYERLDPGIIWDYFAKYNEQRENHFFNTNNQFKQYDPRIENEDTAKMSSGLTNMAGIFNKLSGGFKQLPDKFWKEEGK